MVVPARLLHRRAGLSTTDEGLMDQGARDHSALRVVGGDSNSTAAPLLMQENDLVSEIGRLVAGRRTPLLVAVDGRSGSGKSTLAARVAARLAGTVVEGDDFFAGGTDAEWHRRTVQERIDRGIDWRRLKAEALDPLVAGHRATWHPFNFATGVGLAAQRVSRDPAAVIILDGAYSSRPELADMLDRTLLVVLSDDAVRRQRLLAREGEAFMTAWHALWDAAENEYFTRVRPRASFDWVITRD